MKCNRCKKEVIDEFELFHPVDENCVEIYPDQDFCESCSMEIESEEYEKKNPRLNEKEILIKLKKALGLN